MEAIRINGHDYRVVVNWRAITTFFRLKGTDTMQALSDIGALAPSDLALLAWCCLSEGARVQGEQFDLPQDFIDELQISEAMTIIAAFITIYSEQSRPKVAEKPSKKD